MITFIFIPEGTLVGGLLVNLRSSGIQMHVRKEDLNPDHSANDINASSQLLGVLS